MLKFLIASVREAQAQECTQELLMQAIDDTHTHQICQDILTAKGDEQREDELKGKLRFLLPQVSKFAGVKKEKEGATASYLVFLDLDHLKVNPRDEYERIKQILDDLGIDIIFAQISARNEGLHIVLLVPEGIEVDVEGTGTEDAIRYYERLLDIKADSQCKNVNRGMYITDREHTLMVNEEILFGDVDVVRPKAIPEYLESAPVSEESEIEKEDGRNYPTEYRDGLTYDAIRDELLRMYNDIELDENGRPKYGCRNLAEHHLASDLAAITDYNPDWLKQIIPNYEQDETKWLSTLRSATKNVGQYGMKYRLRQAIKNLTESSSVNSESEGSDSTENSLPKRPAKLPKMIDVCTQVVPEVCRDYIAHAVIPLFANYLSDVKVWHPDNSLKAMFYYCIVVAPSESGKEAIKTLQEVIMDEIKQSDRHWREELAEYSKEEKRTRNNKSDERPEFPEGLHIQWLASSLTAAAFLLRTQWCRLAGNKSVYTYYPEIDALKGLETNGFKDFTTIIRNAFDNEEIGRECATSDGLTGQEKIAWNFNGSTTPENYQFFKGWVGNGTAGRIDYVTILPNPLQKKFKYLRVDDEKKEELKKVLQPYIDNLKSAKGNLECPEALELAERMEDYIDERKNLYDDLAAKYMGNRCKIIAFRIAMLLWIANGQEWTKEIEDFAWWCMEYGLAVKNLLFADQLQDLEKKSRRISSNGIPGRKGILELLPNEGFTDNDFFQAKKKNGFMGNLKEAQTALNVLKSRGNVIKSEEGLWFKTEKYLKQHGQSA